MATKDHWKFQRGTLWSVELKDLDLRLVEANLPVEFSQIEKDSLPWLLATVEQMDPIAPEALARRFETGRRCFVARVEGLVAAYGWVTLGPEFVGEFERELQVREGEAYVWDCATLPKYRRQRLFSALLSSLTGQLRQEGLNRIWIIGLTVAREINFGVAAAGFRSMMHLTYLRLIDRRVLALYPHQGVAASQIASTRRLLQMEGERAFGPLLVGNSRLPVPPETHFDGKVE
jgi:GNAT superfamily N-acetyltransferase